PRMTMLRAADGDQANPTRGAKFVRSGSIKPFCTSGTFGRRYWGSALPASTKPPIGAPLPGAPYPNASKVATPPPPPSPAQPPPCLVDGQIEFIPQPEI